MADPSNVFVISSDFCHWGQRFRYQHYDEKCGDIWESIKVGVVMTFLMLNILTLDLVSGLPINDILPPPKHQALDYAGMNIIETLDHEAFTAYLKKYGNTICGRNPIGVLLGTIAAMRAGAKKTRCKCDLRN